VTPAEPVLPSYPLPDSMPLLELTYAEHQSDYRPLPSLHSVTGKRGRVTTRWKLTWRERFEIFFGGNLWLQVLTFHESLQPQLPLSREPSPDECL
jgi:hypothetical protein